MGAGAPPTPAPEPDPASRRAGRCPRVLRWRTLTGVAALVLVAGTILVAALGRGSTAPPRPPGPDTVVPATALGATAPAATPAPLPDAPLPVPEPPPADPYERVPVVAIGEIEIPRIGLVHTLYEGVSLTVVDRGPGHWPGTAAPGGWGNVVIAGHRTTNSRPFRHIDQLEPGDAIVLRTEAGSFTYVVTGSRVVEEHEMWIVDQHPGRTITLFACHPPGSAQYRYVVFGELLVS